MKNQLSIKFEIFKQLYAIWNAENMSIHQVALAAGIKPFIMHQMACGKPVGWRHYFKLMSYYGYDLDIKLFKKDS